MCSAEDYIVPAWSYTIFLHTSHCGNTPPLSGSTTRSPVRRWLSFLFFVQLHSLTSTKNTVIRMGCSETTMLSARHWLQRYPSTGQRSSRNGVLWKDGAPWDVEVDISTWSNSFLFLYLNAINTSHLCSIFLGRAFSEDRGCYCSLTRWAGVYIVLDWCENLVLWTSWSV